MPSTHASSQYSDYRVLQEWQKAVLRDDAMPMIVRGLAVLVASYGESGHMTPKQRLYAPSGPTLAQVAGRTPKSVERYLGDLRRSGWLRAQPNTGGRTWYCIAPYDVETRALVQPVSSEPCPRCFPAAPDFGVGGPPSPMSDIQVRQELVAGEELIALAEGVSDRAVEMAARLHERRRREISDNELILFANRADALLVQHGQEFVDHLVTQLAEKSRGITDKSIDSFATNITRFWGQRKAKPRVDLTPEEQRALHEHRDDAISLEAAFGASSQVKWLRRKRTDGRLREVLEEWERTRGTALRAQRERPHDDPRDMF